jgi:hypothetical protein
MDVRVEGSDSNNPMHFGEAKWHLICLPSTGDDTAYDEDNLSLLLLWKMKAETKTLLEKWA